MKVLCNHCFDYRIAFISSFCSEWCAEKLGRHLRRMEVEWELFWRELVGVDHRARFDDHRPTRYRPYSLRYRRYMGKRVDALPVSLYSP